jgi:HPt (histidine-containing phosphotransfer) domain-containing protein
MIDPERIADLERVLPEPLSEIVAELVQSMDGTIGRAGEAVAARELDEAARAAHRCRNDALIVGARQLLDALARLETAANHWEQEAAEHALDAVREAWPLTRLELEQAAQAGP